jgi:hypothetical protein
VTLVTGIWLTMRRFGGFFRLRWLTIHQALALLILLNAVLLLGPLGERLLDVARSMDQGRPLSDVMQRLSNREALLGACNLLLTIGAVAIATFKPRLRGSTEGKQTLA